MMKHKIVTCICELTLDFLCIQALCYTDGWYKLALVDLRVVMYLHRGFSAVRTSVDTHCFWLARMMMFLEIGHVASHRCCILLQVSDMFIGDSFLEHIPVCAL